MAKITIVNEEGQNLNRYKMTPVDGQANTYDLERAANITKQGTPFSPETMDHYTQDEDLTAHTGDADIHVTAEKKAAWDGGMVSAYTHTKTGTNHDLAGTGNNITFLAKFAIADGDTWSVNGTAVTAALQNGDPLPADLFKPGNWVTGVRLDGTKLGFKSAGGGVKLNIFCQPTLPPTFDGLAVISPQVTPSKLITKDSFSIGGTWQTGSQNITGDSSHQYETVVVGDDLFYMNGVYNASMFTFSLKKFNRVTKTQTIIKTVKTFYSGFSFVFDGQMFLYYRPTSGSSTATLSKIAFDTGNETILSTTCDISIISMLVVKGQYGRNKYFTDTRLSGNTVIPINALNMDTYTKTLISADFGESSGASNKFKGVINGNMLYMALADSNSKIYKRNLDTGALTRGNVNVTGYSNLTESQGTYCYLNASLDRYNFDTDTVSTTGILPPVTNTTNLELCGLGIFPNKMIVLLSFSEGTDKSAYYYITSEQLPENSLAIQTGSKYKTKIYVSKDGLFSLDWSFFNFWLYQNGDFKELPSYYGTGAAWTKFKN